MKKGEKIQAAERVLLDRPKRASDLPQEDLVRIVDDLQTYFYGDKDGETWNPDDELEGSNVIQFIGLLLAGAGLEVSLDHKGKAVEPVDYTRHAREEHQRIRRNARIGMILAAGGITLSILSMVLRWLS